MRAIVIVIIIIITTYMLITAVTFYMENHSMLLR